MQVNYLGDNILDCWDRTGSYWECWFERAKVLFPDAEDPVTKLDLIWGISAVQNALLVYYLNSKPAKINEINNTMKSLKDIVDSPSFKLWESLSIVDSNLLAIRNIGGEIYGITVKEWITIETRGYYLMMGFSNVREFYSWVSMVLMWAYALSGDFTLKQKSIEYLNKFINPPSSVPQDLLVTPASTNEQVMEDFSNQVVNYIQEEWETQIQPFLYGDKLKKIREFVSAEWNMTKDTIKLAVQNKGNKEEEGIDWVLMAMFGVGGYLGWKWIASNFGS